MEKFCKDCVHFNGERIAKCLRQQRQLVSPVFGRTYLDGAVGCGEERGPRPWWAAFLPGMANCGPDGVFWELDADTVAKRAAYLAEVEAKLSETPAQTPVVENWGL